MKLKYDELVKHTKKTYDFYENECGKPEDAFWLIHPRDYHYLKHELEKSVPKIIPAPQLLGVEAILAHIWRKPPIIAINIKTVDFFKETIDDDI